MGRRKGVIADRTPFLTWHALVQPGPKKGSHSKPRTGAFYRQDRPTVTPVVEPPENYRGGRQPGRANLTYTKGLQHRLGLAWSKRHANPRLRAERAERRAEGARIRAAREAAEQARDAA